MSSTERRPRCLQCLGLVVAFSALAQQPDPSSLVTMGQITVDGRPVPYRIRHLPVSSYPDLPLAVAGELTRRSCLIPQTYEAHRPENVIHASFERPGSNDWAVLCSQQGTVSLLVFFASAPERPATVASAPETDRLHAYPGSDLLGFNWGIDPASPAKIRDAQIGLTPRPPRLDHDALADSVIDHKTNYRYFSNGAWSLVDLPD